MRRARGLLIFSLAAGLAACGAIPENRAIRIDPPQPLARSPAPPFPRPGAVAVLPFDGRGVLRERSLAYVAAGSPTAVRQAATIAWEEAPNLAARAYLLAALRQNGVDAHAATAARPSAYTLSGTLQRFELVDGGRPMAENTGIATVAIDLSLSETESAAPYLAVSYCAAIAATDKSLPAVEIAFDQALSRIAAHLLDDLAARAAGQSPASLPRGSRLSSC